MNTITLEGNKYDIIKEIKGDGRCFSASIYYYLNNRNPDDDILNKWIFEFIINPILATEQTNCPKFFEWANLWAIIHNSDLDKPEYFSIISTNVKIAPNMETINNIFTKLDELQEKNQKFTGTSISSITKLFSSFMETILGISDEQTFKELNPEFDKLFIQLQNMISGYISTLEINSDPNNDLHRVFRQQLYDKIQQIKKTICEKIKNTSDYQTMIELYKRYIKALNKPQKQGDDIFYEYTEPNVGPIDILFDLPTIKSINIYSAYTKQFQNYSNPNPNSGKDIYLYYTGGNHYQPLYPMLTNNIQDPSIINSKVEDSRDNFPPVLNPPPFTNIDESTTIKMTPVFASGIDDESSIKTMDNSLIKTMDNSSIKTMDESPISQLDVSSTVKNTEPNEKKGIKVPNSIIIYIKTRIPNFYKLNYDPFMSVPKTKSHTVYFDPLIKYYEGPIKNVPYGAPKDAILTQFFEATEFDSMINRILSDFRYMQKPRTFKEAYDQQIIENNIRITLKTLFKPNHVFYINKKPYTIVGVKSNPKDYQIHQKPLEKLLNQFPHLSPNQLQEDIKKEEDDIPEILRQSNISSENIANDEKLSLLASGLQKVIDSTTKKDIETEIAGLTESFITRDKLPGVSSALGKLYTQYLRQNIPINYYDIPDLSRDPLTISLLINPADLLNFINTYKKTNLIDLYTSFSNSKITLEQAEKTYVDICLELEEYEKKFDEKIIEITTRIKGSISTNIPLNITEKNSIIDQITNFKINYMKIIFKFADTFMDIYTFQRVYFISTMELLIVLKNDYVNIIKYYEKPELAIKCIENDIYTLGLLINEDSNNDYSQSYFDNYKNFKQFYENNLYRNKQELLEPQINYRDEAEIYLKEPDVLLIQKKQYDIYNIKMFLFYSYNQFDIWVALFKSIELFIDFIGRETTDIISYSDSSLNKLNKSYTNEEQIKFLKDIDAKGVDFTFDKQTQSVKWNLVKQDGTKAVTPSSDEHFEELYLDYVKSSVKSYDAIILYVYLLEILCLRQTRVYIAEENVNQLNLEFSLNLYDYYEILIKTLKRDNNAYIPTSIMWETDKLNSIDYIVKKKQVNDKAYIIYRGRLKSLKESRNDIVKSCEEISNTLYPTISKKGFIDKCKNIIIENVETIKKHSFKSSHWISKTIENYSIQNTNDFIYYMNKVVKDAWHDRVVDDIYPKDYLDWIVFDNDSDNLNDSLYETISYGLNRQLDITNNETTNPYTIEINGKKIFNVQTLKQLIKETNNISEEVINSLSLTKILSFLQNTLKIKFIIFEMFKRKSNQITIGDIVLYDKNPFRVIDINKMEDYATYNLYNGYSQINNVLKDDIEFADENILNNFRLFCQYDYYEETSEFNDYMYLLLVNKNEEEKGYKRTFQFQLIQEADKNVVIPMSDIPIYIKYFIFNNCPNVKLGVQTIRKMGFKEMETELLEFEDKRQKHIDEYNIESDILDVKESINKYKKRLDELKNIKHKYKSLEEQAEKLLLKEEIKDLKSRKKLLEEYRNEGSYSAINVNPSINSSINSSPDVKIGGEILLNPNKQYNGSQYNPIGYPLNPNMPSNVVYIQQGYRGNPYNIPYNVSQNKAKDQKSKMSFYITIELELFPGTSANVFQKSVVKCQSTFERIREAWADIFGFEYRPSPMSSVYTEKKELEKKESVNNKSIKKRISNKNKTQKREISK